MFVSGSSLFACDAAFAFSLESSPANTNLISFQIQTARFF